MSSPATSYTPPVIPSDDEVLVRVDGVGKKFCRSLKKSLWYGVCDIAGELLPGRKRQRVAGRELLVASENTSAEGASGPATSYPPLVTLPTGEASLREGEFWAVKDVSFELRRGECLGLIGHNGAGKTTLLKMLNGLIKPDRGTITMRGRVGALIALGAGFNPILTGRENIYINGSVLGLTKKEIEEKIDEIIDFAEIREFIDMPVQSYSSGMSVRLGFAVASSMEPDVLIIDEVLAVGDFSFRKKCYERISQLLSKSAVIFVSHQMEQIKRLCRSGLLLEKGRMDKFGSISEVASVYEEKLAGKNETSLENFFSTSISGGVVEIQDRVINFRDNLNIIFNLKTNKKLAKLLFRIAFVSINGEIVAEWSSNNANNYSIEYHDNTIYGSILIMKLPIKPGKYKIIFMVNDINNTHYIAVFKKGLGIEIEGDKTMNHYVQLFS